MSHVVVRRRSFGRQLFGLQLFLIAVALVFAAGVSTTMSSAHAQMESPPLPPPMPPPPPPPMPTSPMPQFSGSWTEADPFTVTLFFGENYKTVNEQWTENTTGDNLAHEQHEGVDYAAGESWIRGSQGNVTFCYQLFQGNWVLVNCMGGKGENKDSDVLAIEKNVNPWVQYLAENSYNSTQHNLVVNLPAVMIPGQPAVDADFGLLSYSSEQGRSWSYLGVAKSAWDYQLTLPDNLTTGWMEQYDPIENGIQVTHFMYWIEFVGGVYVQRQQETVMIRPQ